jgi:acetyltransferase-like isoleucine patch superfamily enzyme
MEKNGSKITTGNWKIMNQSYVEIVIRKLKKDPEYNFSSPNTSLQIFLIVYYRAKQVMRGIIKRLWMKQIKGILFCGRDVVIEHGNQIFAGNNLILEDNVYINALSKDGIHLGDNVTIAKKSILACTGVIRCMGKGIKIGNNSAVGAQSFIGGQGGVSIGDNVIIGPGVKIFSENHNYDRNDTLIRLQGESRKGVVINDDCWIGASSTILDGVTIERGCVVAAGSVVTKDISANSIVAGVPAKIIKSR